MENCTRPTFSIFAEGIATSDNKSMIAISNTGTSVIKIQQISLVNDISTNGLATTCEFRFHRIASQTNGSILTPVQFDTLDTLPSDITITTGATISGETGLFKSAVWSTREYDSTVFEQALQDLIPLWENKDHQKQVTIRQNEGVHIRCVTSANNGIFTIFVTFTVEP